MIFASALTSRGCRLLLLTVCVALVAACGSQTAPRASGPGAALIAAYPEGLTALGLDGSLRGVLVPADARGTPSSPAVSPDGAQIAFLMATPADTAGGDSATDLWIGNRDGGHARQLVRHPQPNHSLRAPQWEDGQHMLVVVDRPATCDGCNADSTTRQVLERVDVSTQQMEPLRDGVTAFDLSPDRGTVIYPDMSGDRAEALSRAALDASSGETLVPLSQGFALISSPRYSPDGSLIAFAAAESRSIAARPLAVWRAAWAPAAAPDFDGLPEDIWVMTASGQDLRLVTTLRENQPGLAWSSEGDALYVIGAVSLYKIDLATGRTQNIGRGALRSQIALLPAVAR